MKHKKTWTKSARLEVSEGIERKVSKSWQPRLAVSKYRLNIKVKYSKPSSEWLLKTLQMRVITKMNGVITPSLNG